ncbi:MAG TPA: carboxypeptidase regulatory-like domain-containing protein [Polyangiaceae bacterium]|nr:carboxypeptidase regulatory-like domain-containing protein [Polyangiaceae bacterium]
MLEAGAPHVLQHAPPRTPAARRSSVEPMKGGEHISGHVTDATGGNVGGARVSVSTGAEPAFAVSDDAGDFELKLAPGKGTLLVQAEGYSKLERDVWVPSSDIALVLVPASSIRGRAVAAGTGAPLGGLLVYTASTNALRVPTDPVATVSDGAFSVDDLAAGTYAISAVGAEWRSEQHSVTLAVGETLDELVLEAAPATHLIADVSVGGDPCPHGALALTGPLALSTQIEAGALRVDGLLPGTYDAEVRCDGAASHQEQLLVGKEPLRREWQLDPGLSLHGSVETDDGAPVAGATVQVTPSEPLADARDVRCVSDADGRFECGGLLPGDYDCLLEPAYGADRQSIRIADASAPAFVRLRSLATGSIRVQLLAPEPADLATLALRARRGDGRWIEGRAEAGGFRFADLPLGDYELAFDPPGIDAVHAVLSRAGESLTLALPLPPRGSLSGRVVDERGEPVVEAWVIARPSGADLPPLRKSAVPVLTDAAGEFVVERLLRGRYDLEIVASSGSSSVSAVETGGASLSIELPTHASVTVRATLDGAPVEQFSLAYAEAPGTTRHVGQVANGLWAEPNLPPGAYRFAASSHGAGAVQSIDVAPGSQLELVLALRPAPVLETADAAELLQSDSESPAGGG